MPSGLGLIKGSLRANKEAENKCPGQKLKKPDSRCCQQMPDNTQMFSHLMLFI